MPTRIGPDEGFAQRTADLLLAVLQADGPQARQAAQDLCDMPETGLDGLVVALCQLVNRLGGQQYGAEWPRVIHLALLTAPINDAGETDHRQQGGQQEGTNP